ncbi:MAG: hypothetical protein AAGN82_18270 [Myxococcota bacterium]
MPDTTTRAAARAAWVGAGWAVFFVAAGCPARPDPGRDPGDVAQGDRRDDVGAQTSDPTLVRTRPPALEEVFAAAGAGALIGARGVHLMSRGGAIDTVAHFADGAALFASHPWLERGLGTSCPLSRGTPDHDCGEGFRDLEQGCFVDAAVGYSGVSRRIADLIEHAGHDYSASATEAARAMEKDVEVTVTIVEAKLKLYFGRDADGAWELLVVDATIYDCGA